MWFWIAAIVLTNLELISSTESPINETTEALTTSTATPNPCWGQNLTVSGDDLKYIYSPGYPGFYPTHLNCSWFLTVQTGLISLKFVEIETDEYPTCDSIRIFKGHSFEESESIVSLCGEYRNYFINGTDNKLTVLFQSDRNLRLGKGFKASFFNNPESGWDHHISGQNEGILLSPNFPKRYAKGTFQVWHILINPEPTGENFHIVQVEIRFLFGKPLREDELWIYDSETVGVKKLGFYYVDNWEPTILLNSSGPVMTLSFKSGSGQRTEEEETGGFLITFKRLKVPCVFIIEKSWSGSFQSPNFHSPSINCTWYLKVATPHLSLTFDKLSTLRYSGYVTVYSGHSTQEKDLLVTLAGEQDGFHITGSTNLMTVTLISNNWQDSFEGFKAKFSVDMDPQTGTIIIPSDAVTNSRRGAIMSPNFPSPYYDSRTVIWQITVPHDFEFKYVIRFCVKSLRIGKRVLEVFDGKSNRYPLLAHYTGEASRVFEEDVCIEHFPVSSTCNVLTIQYLGFDVDSPESKQVGFLATYERVQMGFHSQERYCTARSPKPSPVGHLTTSEAIAIIVTVILAAVILMVVIEAFRRRFRRAGVRPRPSVTPGFSARSPEQIQYPSEDPIISYPNLPTYEEALTLPKYRSNSHGPIPFHPRAEEASDEGINFDQQRVADFPPPLEEAEEDEAVGGREGAIEAPIIRPTRSETFV